MVSTDRSWTAVQVAGVPEYLPDSKNSLMLGTSQRYFWMYVTGQKLRSQILVAISVTSRRVLSLIFASLSTQLEKTHPISTL